jgi:hypothetical protein
MGVDVERALLFARAACEAAESDAVRAEAHYASGRAHQLRPSMLDASVEFMLSLNLRPGFVPARIGAAQCAVAGKKPADVDWMAYIYGTAAGLVPWGIIIAYIAATPNLNLVPSFVWAILVVYFLLFQSFPLQCTCSILSAAGAPTRATRSSKMEGTTLASGPTRCE